MMHLTKKRCSQPWLPVWGSRFLSKLVWDIGLNFHLALVVVGKIYGSTILPQVTTGCGWMVSNRFHLFGGFLKWWYPTTIGFPTKNDHFGVFWGYHHFRKHPSIAPKLVIMLVVFSIGFLWRKKLPMWADTPRRGSLSMTPIRIIS